MVGGRLPELEDWWRLMKESVIHMGVDRDKKGNVIECKRANSFTYVESRVDFFSPKTESKRRDLGGYYWNRSSQGKQVVDDKAEMDYPLLGVEDRTLQTDFFFDNKKQLGIANLRVYILDRNDHKNVVSSLCSSRGTPQIVHDTYAIFIKFVSYLSKISAYIHKPTNVVYWYNEEWFDEYIEDVEEYEIDRQSNLVLSNKMKELNRDILHRTMGFEGASALFGTHSTLNLPYWPCSSSTSPSFFRKKKESSDSSE
jgi:hypothetical protein